MKLGPISATAITHCVRLAKCDGYLRFRLHEDELNTMIEYIRDLDGAVLKVGEGDILPQIEDPENGCDLELYTITLSQIMEGQASDLARVAPAGFDSLDYSVGYECNRFVFNRLCMVPMCVGVN